MPERCPGDHPHLYFFFKYENEFYHVREGDLFFRWSKWHTTSPAMFIQPLQVGGALTAVVLVAYIFQLVTRAQALREYSDIHGSARWAKLPDIKQAGLINQVFIEAIGKKRSRFTSIAALRCATRRKDQLWCLHSALNDACQLESLNTIGGGSGHAGCRLRKAGDAPTPSVDLHSIRRLCNYVSR
jgi:hypothetical protein